MPSGSRTGWVLIAIAAAGAAVYHLSWNARRLPHASDDATHPRGEAGR